MIEKNPLVSVIVPCYNHEKYIEECILSIINQTYENIEIIVVDDGSKDKSAEILEQLSKKYNFYFERQSNQGVSKTLNKCLSYANSDLVVGISSDDALMPNAVNDFISKYIEVGGNFSAIFGDSFLINDKSQRIKINEVKSIANEGDNLVFSTFIDYYKYYNKELLNTKYIGSYYSLLIENYISVGIMMKKSALVGIGAWDENLKIEDYDLWLRLSKICKFEYTNTIVSRYRFHENNTIKQYASVLAEHTAEMLIKEKIYLNNDVTKKAWNTAYNNNLIRFLRYRKYNSFLKYYQFKSSFVFFIVKKIFVNFFK